MWVKTEIVLDETAQVFQRTWHKCCSFYYFFKGTYHVQPRPLIFNPPPPPQFQSVWSSPNAETYMQPPTMMNPITQYVQVTMACILLRFVSSLPELCNHMYGLDGKCNTVQSLLEYFKYEEFVPFVYTLSFLVLFSLC